MTHDAMTCEQTRDLFSALIDEALEGGERAAAEAHLAACADCRGEWGRFTRTVALLRGMEPARAPAGFVDRVVAAVRPPPWHRRLASRLFLPLGVKLPLEAAAVVLIGVGVAYQHQRSPDLRERARFEVHREVSLPAREPAAVPAGERTRVSPEPSRAEPTVVTMTREVAESPAVGAERPGAGAPGAGRSRALAERSPGEPAARARRETAERVEDSARGQPLRYERRLTQPRPASPTSPRALGAPAPRAEPPARVRGVVSTEVGEGVSVAGRLRVEDKAAARRAIASLLARLGGAEVSQQESDEGVLLVLDLPGAAYSEFAASLAAIGAWDAPGEGGRLPARARVLVRITR